jgi:CubicO group peptidase (beta-lactamase class C family)
MSVRDALMHMTGFGWGGGNTPFATRARAGLDGFAMSIMSPLDADWTLETLMERLSEPPLRFHPGTRWSYTVSTDVCARLVEVISGQRFDDYLNDQIFEPLGMVDTGFMVPDENVDRFAAMYGRGRDKSLRLLEDPMESGYRKPRTFLSGGGGLVSTAADYLRFAQMMCNGGVLGGARILSRKTVELMTLNHLPGGGQLRDFAVPGGYGEVGFDGTGFGLTVAIGLGPVANQTSGTAGEFMWGGAASTMFWVDRAEELVVILMTQLMPSGTFNFRGQLKSLVYGALAD